VPSAVVAFAVLGRWVVARSGLRHETERVTGARSQLSDSVEASDTDPRFRRCRKGWFM
jgi:hypothetical protein